MADLDVGEYYLNFVLHESIRELKGVDLTLYFGHGESTVLWETWTRAMMGAKSSPYQACQACCVADKIIQGNPNDPNNDFRWDCVHLKCPGQKD